MSRYKKLKLSLIFVLLMTITFFTVNNVNASESILNSDVNYRQQEISAKQNNKILNSFREQIYKSKSSSSYEDIELCYPDYYGGSYLDDKGKLVILLKDPNPTTKANLKNISGNNDLTFRNANFSYAELCKIINTILEIQEAHLNDADYESEIYSDICDCTLNDMGNNITVGIKDLSDKKILEFENKVVKSNALVFKNAGKPQTYSEKPAYDTLESHQVKRANISKVVRPGQSLVGGNLKFYSLGFPVYRTIGAGTKQYGYVTAGHYASVGMTMTDEATMVVGGSVKLNKVSGKYDVSFVALDSGGTCSNSINNTPKTLVPSNEEIDYPISGKVVYAYGRVTNSSGKITSTNYSYLNKDLKITFTDMIKTNIFCAQGDSGGLLASNHPTENLRMIQEGIICGASTDSNNNVDGTYCCSAINIVNLWYLVCY